VLLLMFDENDGFFDHLPPPAPPSRADGRALGGSTVDTSGEHHLMRAKSEAKAERDELAGRPYGLGPRVPLYIISPWSRGGWVNSEVFDHTSVIRFLEQCFGVAEPNISQWRRTVCGDLTSAFNFRTPNDAPFAKRLPETRTVAARAAALPGRTTPPTPERPLVPVQAAGPRPSRALPYHLSIDEAVEAGGLKLSFDNRGRAGAVFHVYDRRHLDRVPRRYTVGPGRLLEDVLETGEHDLWILGPNGFHRHYVGDTRRAEPLVFAAYERRATALTLTLSNPSSAAQRVRVTPHAYERALKPWRVELPAKGEASHRWPLAATRGWYDLVVRLDEPGRYLRRLAGRLETEEDSISDPAMAGPALMAQDFPV